MIGELLKIAGQCDGLRCDMAMLVLPEVFERTWGRPAPLFWPNATRRVRELVPGFRFMAEVYWDLEWTMLQQGFDYAYDKRLYDRLREGHSDLRAWSASMPGSTANRRSGEPRRAAGCRRIRAGHARGRCGRQLSLAWPPGFSTSCRSVCLEGRSKRISPHLVRAPLEPVDEALRSFYDALLMVLRDPAVRDGEWRMLECAPAWEGNWTSNCFIAWCWGRGDVIQRLITVNYAGNQSQCYVPLRISQASGRPVRLRDLLGSASYERDGTCSQSRGIYLDLPPWGYHLFEVTRL